MSRILSACAVLTAGGLTAACATTAADIPQPALQFARADCAASPSLAGPIGLTPEKERVSHLVVAPVGTASGCLARDGKAGPYVVFALPADYDDKTITVGGALEATRIFAPSVAVLDASGTVTRTFSREDYLYRGPVYSVQFRPRQNETYVLVTSDPELVGKRYDSVSIGTNTTTICTGYTCSNWTTGVDASQSRVFSYEGTVQVAVYDTDIKEGR